MNSCKHGRLRSDRYMATSGTSGKPLFCKCCGNLFAILSPSFPTDTAEPTLCTECSEFEPRLKVQVADEQTAGERL